MRLTISVGSRLKLLAHLMEERRLSDTELARMRELPRQSATSPRTR